METKKRSGRPRKADDQKVKYQRIAVYTKDYLRLVNEIKRWNKGRPKKEHIKLTDAFTGMVDNFINKD